MIRTSGVDGFRKRDHMTDHMVRPAVDRPGPGVAGACSMLRTRVFDFCAIVLLSFSLFSVVATGSLLSPSLFSPRPAYDSDGEGDDEEREGGVGKRVRRREDARDVSGDDLL